MGQKVGGWRSGPVLALRLEAPAYAKASAFVITSARQVGAAWGIGQREIISDFGFRIANLKARSQGPGVNKKA